MYYILYMCTAVHVHVHLPTAFTADVQQVYQLGLQIYLGTYLGHVSAFLQSNYLRAAAMQHAVCIAVASVHSCTCT